MKFLKVNNWEDFQHYKDRNPPWIKLYNTLLSDYEFTCLQDDSKLLLIMIYLIASQTNNKIPYDEQWVKHKAMLDMEVDLKPLIDAGFLLLVQDDSEVIAKRKRDAIPEQSRAEQRERREDIYSDLPKFKKIYEQEMSTVSRNYTTSERKKLVELINDFSVEEVLKCYRYFLKHVSDFTDRAGDESVDWFHKQYNQVQQRMNGTSQRSDLTPAQIRARES